MKVKTLMKKMYHDTNIIVTYCQEVIDSCHCFTPLDEDTLNMDVETIYPINKNDYNLQIEVTSESYYKSRYFKDRVTKEV